MKSYEEYENKLDYGRDFLATGAANVFKYLDRISGDFWSCKKILSYGRPFNFVLSGRSVGKSTNIACFVLLDYIKNGRRFIYCRRDKDTVSLTATSFFENAVQILNEVLPTFPEFKGFKMKLKLVGRDYYISYGVDEDGEDVWEEESIGSTIALSLERKSKSSALGTVYNVIFDEFVERDPTKYLGNSETMDKVEYRAVMSLYHTIDRRVGRVFRNETRFFFLGNIETKFCPLLMKLGIADYMVRGANFIAPKDKQWVLEQVRGIDALKGREQSFAYQLSTEDELEYSFSSDVSEDQTFVKQPEVSEYVMTVSLEGREYGIRRSIHQVVDELYICKPMPGWQVLSLDLKGHTGLDYQLIKSWRQHPVTTRLAEYFQRGLLYFDREDTKNTFLKYLQFTV